MTRTKQALKYHDEYFCCSQSVVAAYSDLWGLDTGTALRIGSGFGAGFGRNGEICGAVSGAVMLIGLKYGGSEPFNRQPKEDCYTKTRELMERFAAKCGSCKCGELLGLDFATTDPLAITERCKQVCCGYISAACELIENMLLEDEYK